MAAAGPTSAALSVFFGTRDPSEAALHTSLGCQPGVRPSRDLNDTVPGKPQRRSGSRSGAASSAEAKKKLMKRVTTTCVLSLALSCGGRTVHRQTDGQAGARSTNSVAGAQSTNSVAGARSTDSIAGARATQSQAGAWTAGGSAGFQATGDDTVPQDTAAGAPPTWVARGGFDELPLSPLPDAGRAASFRGRCAR